MEHCLRRATLEDGTAAPAIDTGSQGLQGPSSGTLGVHVPVASSAGVLPVTNEVIWDARAV
jgi:hypothetical protein